MFRRNNQNSRKSNKNKTSNRRVDNSAKELTARASGREFSYSIGTINGSGGVLLPTSGVASTTDTGGRYTIILPESIGVRCSQLARLYNEYKINSLEFRYRPNSYQLGTQTLSTVTQFSGNMYSGITLDPTTGILVQTEIVEAGGKIWNFARPRTIGMYNSTWLYTSPRVSDTLSDNRFISPGILNWQSAFNGGETSIKLGDVEVAWDISFRYPIDADSEPLRRQPVPYGMELISLLSKRSPGSGDEKKDDNHFSGKEDEYLSVDHSQVQNSLVRSTRVNGFVDSAVVTLPRPPIISVSQPATPAGVPSKGSRWL